MGRRWRARWRPGEREWWWRGLGVVDGYGWRGERGARRGVWGSGSGSGWPYAIGLPRRQPHTLPVESGRRRSRARLYPEPPIATGGVQPVASLCWQGVRERRTTSLRLVPGRHAGIHLAGALSRCIRSPSRLCRFSPVLAPAAGFALCPGSACLLVFHGSAACWLFGRGVCWWVSGGSCPACRIFAGGVVCLVGWWSGAWFIGRACPCTAVAWATALCGSVLPYHPVLTCHLLALTQDAGIGHVYFIRMAEGAAL